MSGEMVPNGSSSMTSISASLVFAAGSLREKRKADPAKALVLRKLRRCMFFPWVLAARPIGKHLLAHVNSIQTDSPVPAQFLAKLVEPGIRIDAHELNPGDLGKVFHVFQGQRMAEAGVVRPSGVDPCGGSDLQIWARDP